MQGTPNPQQPSPSGGNFVHDAIRPSAETAANAMTNVGNMDILKLLANMLTRNSEGSMGKPTNTRAFKSSEMTTPYKGMTADSPEVKKYNK